MSETSKSDASTNAQPIPAQEPATPAKVKPNHDHLLSAVEKFCWKVLTLCEIRRAVSVGIGK